MKIFFVDIKRDINKSYDDLIEDLNELKGINKYIFENNPYNVVLKIIQSLILGSEVELIDSDLSETEINNIGLNYSKINYSTIPCNINITDIKNLYDEIEKNKLNWKLTLYTSGTTGRPKKVTHNFDTMNRTTRIGDKWANDIWAYAYNPTHYAGLQVLFQAFLNKNSLIYIFDSNFKDISKVFLKYQITNISATPTFYRNAIHFFSEHIESVKRVTSGGEKFDSSLIGNIKNVFPYSKINNVYASTEAGSLFASKGDIFVIRDDIKDYVQINDEGELLIHKKLLGESDIFDNSIWYNTGDIVQLVSDNEFVFVSRKTEMINVGGYKVNPYEVEDEIKKIKGVVDVIVKPRNNSVTGNILSAEVLLSDGISKEDIELVIVNSLNSKLQSWKVPRLIKFVNIIDKTRTGKKVRK